MTNTATGVTNAGATLNGQVAAGAASATVSFQLTTTSGDYSGATTIPATPPTLSGNATSAVSAKASGLTPNTTYFYRVVLTDADGTLAGEERSFVAHNPSLLPILWR